MDKISSNFNLKAQGQTNSSTQYVPSYLARDEKQDSVSFTGKNPKNIKNGLAKVGVTIMAALTALGGALGLSGCNKDNSVVPAADPTTVASVTSVENVENAQTPEKTEENKNVTAVSEQKFDVKSQTPIVTVFSVFKEDDEAVKVKKFPNANRILDDNLPTKNLEKMNSTTKVVRTHSNETDECTTLLEAINKQYVDPFIHNGTLPEKPTEAEMHQMAEEIIEVNEDMQKKIVDNYKVENWRDADIDDVLNDDLYKMGITEFKTPDQVEIHGISSDSLLKAKSESETKLYNTSAKTIELKHDEIENINDLYSVFASAYKDSDGKEADTGAGSIATWLTVKDNQYNKAFKGKINNDGDRTDLMLLDTIKGLKKGESLKLNLPDTFGINYMASGKAIDEVDKGLSYHIVHQMSPSETSFVLNGENKVTDCEQIKEPVDFVEVLQYYYDPDTEEHLADKTELKDGSYEFRYNLNVADLNAKQYAVFEQVAYDNMDFFASKQKIDIDGKVQEFEYGVFDVQKGHEKDVKDAIGKKDYDSAKKYLTFNLDKFVAGSFYNEDGSLKTGDKLQLNLKQFEYVSDSEGSKVEKTEIKKQTPEPEPTPAPTEVPTEKKTELPTQEPTKKPTEPPTDKPTQKPTDGPTVPTEPPTDKPTQKPTDGPTVPTEPPTDKPTQKPTEKPTEKETVPTEPPTQGPTQKPTIPDDNPNPDPEIIRWVPTEPPTPTYPTETPTEEQTVPTEPPTYRTTDPTEWKPTEPPTQNTTEAPTCEPEREDVEPDADKGTAGEFVVVNPISDDSSDTEGTANVTGASGEPPQGEQNLSDIQDTSENSNVLPDVSQDSPESENILPADQEDTPPDADNDPFTKENAWIWDLDV